MKINEMTKSEKLRDLFKQDKIVYTMGAHNGLSAKLAERNKFDAVWASGLEISASFGVPDANILTMTQNLEKSAEMSDAVSIPIISDCDTGFGNSNNVIDMVKKYEAAGVAAVCIEDKLFPKVNSFAHRQELASISEFVGKIMAAKNTQRSKDFMVIARVEALIASMGMDEALLRADRYVEAGADAILIHSKHSDYEEIVEFARKWDKKAPLVIVPTMFPTILNDFTENDLLNLGIKVVIFANQGLRASIKAMDQVMAKIGKTHQLVSLDDQLVSVKDIFDIQGMNQMKEDEEKYLRTNMSDYNAILLAAGGPTANQKSLGSLLRDTPVAMLDINGEPLIKHNINTLSQQGITDITVVTGYKNEQFHILKKVEFIHNPDYSQTNELHSLMLAEKKLKGKTLLAYSDIIFDRFIVERLMKSDAPITLLVDATYKKANLRDKKLDLVITDMPPNLGYRSVDSGQLKKVQEISEDLSNDEAHYEFVGLILFNDKGSKAFIEAYHRIKNDHSQLLEKIGINKMLQKMIDDGFPVSALEVHSGWTELHTFDNYKLVCSSFSSY